MPTRDGGSAAAWPRRAFPVAAAQDDRQEGPGMIVQTVVVAGPKPVKIETEPRARHDPQAVEVERTMATVDRLPAPELKSWAFDHAATLSVSNGDR